MKTKQSLTEQATHPITMRIHGPHRTLQGESRNGHYFTGAYRSVQDALYRISSLTGELVTMPSNADPQHEPSVTINVGDDKFVITGPTS